MLYLSQLLGMPVEDQQQTRIGRLVDVLVPGADNNDIVYPGALLIQDEADTIWRVLLQDVRRDANVLHLRIPLAQAGQVAANPPQREVRLAQDVLDKQVINVERKKAIRVSDICFDDDWRMLGIDHSTLGLVRRLIPGWIKSRPSSLVPWQEIEVVGAQPEAEERSEEVPRSPSGHLAEMHPADIAEIVHHLSAGEGARLIERLDDETAAATMEEIDTERQRQILENIQAERAADILQAMGPDEAADLLASLPEERSQELLRLMTPEESEEVQELLEYEPDTAGGLMTTDYTTLSQQRSVREALDVIRDDIQKYDVRIPYVYCVDDESQEEQRVLGVVSLWDLLIARPEQALAQLMEADVISTQVESNPQDVAETMAKYNLLALPVLNKEGILQGVVTVDDVLDILLPPDRRRRRPRIY